MKASRVTKLYHMTSVGLAAGVPLALLMGAPVTTIADMAFAFMIPLHSHIGMRSVIVDYIWDSSKQRAAIMLLGAFTVLTGGALVRMSLADVGLTQGMKSLWVKQNRPQI
jgi:succinate dehydrogenase hydrophobic anchor subunit